MHNANKPGVTTPRMDTRNEPRETLLPAVQLNDRHICITIEHVVQQSPNYDR
jgi:hypothetical protein